MEETDLDNQILQLLASYGECTRYRLNKKLYGYQPSAYQRRRIYLRLRTLERSGHVMKREVQTFRNGTKLRKHPEISRRWYTYRLTNYRPYVLNIR